MAFGFTSLIPIYTGLSLSLGIRSIIQMELRLLYQVDSLNISVHTTLTIRLRHFARNLSGTAEAKIALHPPARIAGTNAGLS